MCTAGGCFGWPVQSHGLSAAFKVACRPLRVKTLIQTCWRGRVRVSWAVGCVTEAWQVGVVAQRKGVGPARAPYGWAALSWPMPGPLVGRSAVWAALCGCYWLGRGKRQAPSGGLLRQQSLMARRDHCRPTLQLGCALRGEAEAPRSLLPRAGPWGPVSWGWGREVPWVATGQGGPAASPHTISRLSHRPGSHLLPRAARPQLGSHGGCLSHTLTSAMTLRADDMLQIRSDARRKGHLLLLLPNPCSSRAADIMASGMCQPGPRGLAGVTALSAFCLADTGPEASRPTHRGSLGVLPCPPPHAPTEPGFQGRKWAL